MAHHVDVELRTALEREGGRKRSTAPGLLAMWGALPADHPAPLKEVLAIIRPAQWSQTKARVQRLRLPAFTQQRVLGRGRERGLRYLPRQGANRQVAIRYLPKRMVSWVVEAAHVEPLVQAIIAANRTGQLGDGKIFVLPVDDAIRIRTGERGREALQSQRLFETVLGAAPQPASHYETAYASR